MMMRNRERQILEWINNTSGWVTQADVAKGLGLGKNQVRWAMQHMGRSGLIQAHGSRAARRYRKIGEGGEQYKPPPNMNKYTSESRIDILKAIRLFAYENAQFVTVRGIEKRSKRPDRTIYRVLKQLAEAGVLKEAPPRVAGSTRHSFELAVPKLVAEELTQMIKELETHMNQKPQPTPSTQSDQPQYVDLASLVSQFVQASTKMFNIYRLTRHLTVKAQRKVSVEEARKILLDCPDAVQVGSITWKRKQPSAINEDVKAEAPPVSDNEFLKLATPYLLELRGTVSAFTRKQLVIMLESKGLHLTHRTTVIDRLLDWAVRSDILFSSGTTFESLTYQFKNVREPEVQPITSPPKPFFQPTEDQLGKLQEVVNKLNSMSVFTGKVFTLEEVFQRTFSLAFSELEKM